MRQNSGGSGKACGAGAAVWRSGAKRRNRRGSGRKSRRTRRSGGKTKKTAKVAKTAKFSQLLSEVGEAEQGGTTAGKGAH